MARVRFFSNEAAHASHHCVKTDQSARKPLDILLVVEADIATTALIEQVLLACAPLGVKYRKAYLRNLCLSDFNVTTIPMFVRVGDPGRDLWVDLLASARRPYIYYIDDNFWKIKGNSPLALYYQDPGVRRTLERFVRGAQVVLTSSEVLQAYLCCYTQTVRFVAPFFDFSLIQDVVPNPGTERRVGFAGSTSRKDDLAIVVPAVHAVLSRFDDVVFEFIGVLPQGLKLSQRVRFFPPIPDYSDFIRFQASRGWQIGLAPLLANESNRSKTNNKFREYGACGIAGVYSRLEPYAEVVHGETGMLVEHSSDAWEAAISDLLSRPVLASHIGEQARSAVFARYSVDAVALEWAAEFNAVAAARGPDRQFDQRARRKLWWALMAVSLNSLFLRVTLAYREGGSKTVLAKGWRRARRILIRSE